MGMFGGLGKQALNFAGRNLLGVDFEAQKRLEAQRALLERANAEAGGLQMPVPGDIRQSAVGNADGVDITDAFGPVFEQGPSRQRTPQEIAATLSRLQGTVRGFNAKPFVDIAGYAKPNYQVTNDQMYDPATGRAIRDIPKVGENQRRVYDDQGNVVGVMDLQGAIQSVANREEAQALGKERGTLRDVPVGGGATRLMTGRDFMGGAASAANPELGYTPSAAALSGDKIRGDAQAQAQVDLPKDLGGAQQTLDLIQKLKTHPGRQFGTGLTGVLPAMPGSATKDFVTLLDQAKGTGFLTAIGSLRGTGQITEIEGKKATDAIARMDRTQSEEGFMAALKDYEDVVRAGMARAQQRAGAAPQVAPAPPPVGAIVKGFRYKGGDPSKPSSWARP